MKKLNFFSEDEIISNELNKKKDIQLIKND
jgi:hypothetical protein